MVNVLDDVCHVISYSSTFPIHIISSVDQVGLQFIPCDVLHKGSLSIIGYVSAFELPVWACLIFIIVISVVALKTVESFIYSDGKKSYNTLFAPISFLLEQGVQLAYHVFTRLVVVVWIGMGVVLSNAYKGQNITDLTAPLPPVPIKYFKELLELNFTVISRPKSMFSEDEFYVAAYLYNEYTIRGNMSVTVNILRWQLWLEKFATQS